MRILLTGATGFIGGHIQRALLAAGHEVVTCSRRPPPQTRASVIPCEFTRDHAPETWLPRLAGVEAVVNCVGIIRERRKQTFQALHADAPRALFSACEKAGVRRVIQISALGADENAVSRYHKTKRTADDDLAGRDLHWLILRPSIVYGPGAASSALFRAFAALPVTPLIGRGDQPVQPIHIDDLVRSVLTALGPDGPVRRRVDCVGPAPLTFRELLGAWRRWLGMGKMRTMRIPFRWALAAGRLGGFLGNVPMDAEAVAMLQRGNRAAVEPFVDAFGFRPRSFPAALDAMPATEADRWHARLYLLRPLLRWTLGLMWLWAGITSAFLYPVEASFELLAAVGISGAAAPAALYGAALLDGLLGGALLAGYRVRLAGALQIGAMAGYTALITWALPAFWLHPFGPVAKNLPLAVATLIMMALEARTK